MTLISKAFYAIGIMLVIIISSPLIAFFQGIEDTTVEVEVNEGYLIITLHYTPRVPLKDANLTVISGGRIVAYSLDPELTRGEELAVTVPLESIEADYTLVLSGSIAGVYDFSYSISARG